MIKCRWREKKRILFNIDGQVYPCCYLVNNNYKMQENNKTPDRYQHVMQEYNKVKDEMNVFTNDMESINRHEWWDLLEKSWEDAEVPTLRQCTRWCTVKEDNDGDV